MFVFTGKGSNARGCGRRTTMRSKGLGSIRQ
jgi:hypothetical protein